jgi:endogenous inhibitor of DNA gyrase (YacG/DUF329 family)
MLASIIAPDSISTGDIKMKTTKCPVCDWEIKDGGIKVKAGDKQITVCCDECAKKVKANPAKYSGSSK